MSNRETKARERKLQALAAGEENVHERLVGLRSELDSIAYMLDRLTLGPPRMRAGGRSSLDNLLPFRRGRFL
jgi:hypothetical protein